MIHEEEEDEEEQDEEEEEEGRLDSQELIHDNNQVYS